MQDTYPAAEVSSGTDSDTASSFGETQYDFGDVQHLPEPEQGAQLFWAYEHAKARWRRFNNHKPTRKVRRVIKRKGKGKGKGKHARTFLTTMSEDEARTMFVGFGKGKGRGKGKHRTVSYTHLTLPTIRSV